MTIEAPSKSLLAELAEVQDQRLEHSRQAAALKKREEQLLLKLWPWIEAERRQAPKQTVFQRLAHLIELTFKAKTPKWKDEFIKVASASRAADLVTAVAAQSNCTIRVKPLQPAARKAA